MSCFSFATSYNEYNSFKPPKKPFYSVDDGGLDRKSVVSSPKSSRLNSSEGNFSLSKLNKRGGLYEKVPFKLYNYKVNYPYLDVICYTLKKLDKQRTKIILLSIINKSNEEKSELSFTYDFENTQKNTDENDNNNDTNNDNDSDSDLDNTITLLISHSSSSDIGKIFPKLCDMSTVLKCNIVTYDYSGYGCSQGKISYEVLKNDIDLVMDFCLNNLGLRLEQIILMSSTIGAIPNLTLATKLNFCQIKGIVLINPVLDLFDINFDRELLKNIIAPVFLISVGDYDEQIDKEEIRKLKKMFKECLDWFPKDINKVDDIFLKERRKFYGMLKTFMMSFTSSKVRKLDELYGESIN